MLPRDFGIHPKVPTEPKTPGQIGLNIIPSLKEFRTAGKGKSISSKAGVPWSIGPLLLGGTNLGDQGQGMC